MMFEEIKDNLDSLDEVLDMELVEKSIRRDVKSGFDPNAAYNERELFGFKSPEAIKKGRDMCPFVILEAALKSGSEEFTRHYLRGFEEAYTAHIGPVNYFLRALGEKLPAEFKVPFIWSDSYPPPRSISLTAENQRIDLAVLGGGHYRVRDGKITTGGESTVFGPLPSQYRSHLAELLSLLVQKPVYLGFSIDQR